MRNRFTLILRVMLAALVVAFGLMQFAYSHGGYLSTDARQYQQLVWDTMSGLSLWYGVEKLCWLLGITFGAVGILLLFFRIRSGVILLLFSAPLLMVAAVSGAPPPAFPDIERLPVLVLECVTSALWGCVVTYVLTADKMLFSKSPADANAPATKSPKAATAPSPQ